MVMRLIKDGGLDVNRQKVLWFYLKIKVYYKDWRCLVGNICTSEFKRIYKEFFYLLS